MTIKISQLANLTVTQANTIVPVVSNITGTLTTVQASVQQLQDYIIANGVSANITALYTNAAIQSDLIIGINANVITANVGMKGYVDNQTYSNVNVSQYLPTYNGNIGELNLNGDIDIVGTLSVIGAGNLTVTGSTFLANVKVPTLANSSGTAGQITWDSSYVYVCIAANTWRRANLAIW